MNITVAVHPNHVIDAVVAAASKFADSYDYRDNRIEMLQNYCHLFKEHVGSEKIVVTKLNRDPLALYNWYDEENDSVSDPSRIDHERSLAHRIYSDFDHYLQNLNTVTFLEEETGDSCNDPQIAEIIKYADSIEMIGGNLTGCLLGMIRKIEGLTKVVPRVVENITFDDNSKFWKRILLS